MAYLSYSNIGIAGIAACVPKQKIDNYHYTQYFPEDVVRKVVDKIGIYERRFADEHTCASDLCYAAAERLIADLQKDMENYPLKRYGKPEEIAHAIIYLLSDASAWVTGITLTIDGGLLLK